MFVTTSGNKRCSDRPYLQLFVGGFMFYLHHLCLLSHSGVQRILCCVSVVSCVSYATSFFGLSIFCIMYCLLSTKQHVIIASGIKSKMNLKNIANLVSFLVSSHRSPSQRNIGINRPPSTTNLLWIHIPQY